MADKKKVTITVARGSGFCFGVQRAMKLAFDYAEKNNDKGVYSLRQIIHNPQESERLEKAGARHVESVAGIKNGSAAIISTHGVTPAEEKSLRAKAADVLDTTCPYVKKIHRAVEKLKNEGYQIVIVGDKDHYEVKGILGYAADKGIVLNTAADVKKAKLESRVGVVCQTTQSADKFMEIANEVMKKVLVGRYAEVRIFNTICDATQKRQEATVQLAQKSDLMIIVGGKNSANTKRLYELSRGILKQVRHVETADEIKKEWLKGKKKIGISAGASTPESAINGIINKIKYMERNNGK
ncbi:MAG TPA: 4-hydroxy-3-methylbut-2-enyl diphosphate reductase [Candidatus Goldiibacteriota bacterium]|nr:4-hydroxy-3-methylbut-2-enyl diphosphate reductase [Candidatus Goldiibacteriota bacterium]HPN63816.1 4-hydroxy-3-methylbut-2-enyl diphosphate reductase [Candidatus Goldiibacteriota bacterium]HRQ43769.1 4-hydroxy-3-methylbut-2-enyl diphosphate reductase [Candidatus Goldiibacteriota bacterium]